MKRFLNSNYLKLIALISMLFDHVGKVMDFFYPSNEIISGINNAFSIIGRIAFPIFIFLIIEGFAHTKNLKNYFLRLSIMALLIFIIELIFSFIPALNLSGIVYKFGNIFIDLLLVLLSLTILNFKEVWKKFFIVLPLAYLLISLLIQNGTIYLNETSLNVIGGLMPQYSFVTLFIIIAYYLISLLYKRILFSKFDNNINESQLSLIYLTIRQNSYLLAIALLSLLMYAFTYFDVSLNTDPVVNTYFILSMLFIFEYNGQHGKINLLTKYGPYAFYPLHLFLIILIVYLTTL